MAQFRVEFILDPASGKYLAELYHPERGDELLLRTEALYPSQEAAVFAVVQLFKNAIGKAPRPSRPPRAQKAGKAKKNKSAKKMKRKQSSKRRRVAS